jgi:hypothetical protein
MRPAIRLETDRVSWSVDERGRKTGCPKQLQAIRLLAKEALAVREKGET